MFLINYYIIKKIKNLNWCENTFVRELVTDNCILYYALFDLNELKIKQQFPQKLFVTL